MKITSKLSLSTAISLVVANMIGTGVFTSLGFQLLEIRNPLSIVLLWLLGGILALCGALTYGEIGVAFPRSGGEYNYLSKLYHPVVGFLSGWISITVGFAAPVALAAVALGNYMAKVIPGLSINGIAISVVTGLTIIHSTNLKNGSRFQNMATLLKLLIIIIFIFSGFIHHPNHVTSLVLDSSVLNDIISPAFAISLIYVSYAYSGWNASSYIAEEIINPGKNLPRSLLIGTGIVAILYILLNYIFMYSVPTENLKGVIEVGFISANSIFGNVIGNIMGIVIALLLISSISAMVMTGPRVSKAMGEDFLKLNFLAKTNKNNIPIISLIIQCTISIILILSSNFESVLTFIGFTLSLFTFLTVAGIFILRKKVNTEALAYKTFLYPIVPIIYLVLNGWIIIYTAYSKPKESIYGLLIMSLGILVWLFVRSSKHNQTKQL